MNILKSMIRGLLFLCVSLYSLSGFTFALVETFSGDVRAGSSAGAATGVALNQRIEPRSTVVTGAGGQVTLRFDDGQAVVLTENSEFRVVDFTFVRTDPSRDRSVFDLLKGAARFVSGLIASRNPQTALMRVPQATIGVRGTDYMVALVNPAYLTVLSGTIGVSNAAGVVAVAAGTTATVASATVLAATMAAAALPASVAASFSQLGSIAIRVVAAGAGTGTGTGAAGAAGGGAGAGGAAGAGAATAAAAGGITLGTVAVVGVAAAAIAGAASDTSQAATAGTTGTTGTTGTQ